MSPIMAIFAKKYSAPSDMCRKTSSGKTCTGKTYDKENAARIDEDENSEDKDDEN